MADEAGTLRRALRARRRHRLHRAHRGAETDGGDQAAGDRREPSGCGRHARRRDWRQGPARRLYLYRDRRQLCGESQPLQAFVRFRERHHPRHPVLAGAVRHRLPSLAAGEECEGADRDRQVKTGTVELRLQRPGQHHPSCNRALRDDRRHQDDAHPLQGHGTRGDRHDGRPHAAAMGQRGRRRADGEGRQAEGDRRLDDAAYRGPARCSHRE